MAAFGDTTSLDLLTSIQEGTEDYNMTSADCNTTNMYCPNYAPTVYLVATQTFAMILYGVVCIVGLLGNSLVIYVVIRYSNMQTVTNMYIVNLAIADQFFLLGLPFLITTMYLEKWTFGNVMCKVYMTTTSINQITSSVFLTIMSADRYIAVCHPVNSQRLRTPFISKVVSLTAWTASALLMVPVFMYTSTMERSDGTGCNILWPETGNVSGQTAFTLYSFILGFAIPLVLILIFYCLVIRKLQTVGPKNKSKEKKKSHRKVTRLVLTVITVYMLCWLPYWITQVALIFTPPNRCQTSFSVTVFLLAGWLSYSNSAMNPILYAFLSDNFKKSFMKACVCAAGRDVNAALHLENSVFPRKGKDAKRHSAQGGQMDQAANRSCMLNQDAGPSTGLLAPLHPHSSRADMSSTGISMTLRSNITVSSDVILPGPSSGGNGTANGTRSGSVGHPTEL